MMEHLLRGLYGVKSLCAQVNSASCPQRSEKWATAYGLWGESLVWLIEAVVCLLAANRASSCSLARAMDGRAVVSLAHAYQQPYTCRHALCRCVYGRPFNCQGRTTQVVQRKVRHFLEGFTSDSITFWPENGTPITVRERHGQTDRQTDGQDL